MTDKALVRADGAALPSLYVEPRELARQRSAFNEYVNQNLREKVDFGLIPGVDKKTLLKPGAEKILQFYGCALELEETRYDADPNTGYLFVEFRARAVTVNGRVVVGEGVGACSSFESKYRWRWEWWNGKGAPDGDEWERTRNGKYRRRVENRDLIDQWNTVIKMAKKRAHVDLALTISGASEMFTQDVEDFVDADYSVVEPQPQKEPVKREEPAKQKESQTVPAESQTVPMESKPANRGELLTATAKLIEETKAETHGERWNGPHVKEHLKKHYGGKASITQLDDNEILQLQQTLRDELAQLRGAEPENPHAMPPEMGE